MLRQSRKWCWPSVKWCGLRPMMLLALQANMFHSTLKSLLSKICRVLWNKAIHRKVEPLLHAIFIPSAQGRHPRGTSGTPLNAAWSPIWHGSQLPIAQDPPLNTESRTQLVKVRSSSAGSTPAVADFRYRAPLNPRLVWPHFAVWHCAIYYNIYFSILQ